MTSPLLPKVIYGPIRSKRLGLSLGINTLSPYFKICNFECVYCYYGTTGLKTNAPNKESLFSTGMILQEVETALMLNPRVDTITFSGNGEPTLHPDFSNLVTETCRLRDQYLPGVPIAVFTNGTTLTDPKVRAALEFVDLPMVKLDAGDQTTFAEINCPLRGITLEGIIEGIMALPGLILQTLFLKGRVTNQTRKQKDAWMETVGRIRPALVQIYSLNEADEANRVEPLKPYELTAIAEETTRMTGIRAEAIWPPVTWLR